MANSEDIFILRVLNFEDGEDDVLEYFKQFDKTAHILRIYGEGGMTSRSAEIAITQSDQIGIFLKKQHKINDHAVTVLPSIFGEVKVPINKIWIDMMTAQQEVNFMEFLRCNHCQPDVKVKHQGDEWYLEGYVDSVKEAMKKLQDADLRVLRKKHRALKKPEGVDLNYQQGAVSSKSEGDSQDFGGKIDRGASAAMSNPNKPAGGPTDFVGNSDRSILRSNSQHDDKQGQPNSKPNRRLKLPTTAVDICSSLPKDTALPHQLPDYPYTRSIDVPAFKQFFVERYFQKEFKEISNKCDECQVCKNLTSCRWVFSARNQAKLDTIENDFTDFLGNLPIKYQVVKVPAGFVPSYVEEFLKTNESKLAFCHLVKDKDGMAVIVFGDSQNSREIEKTAGWLYDILSSSQTQQTPGNACGRDSGAVVSSDHSASKCCSDRGGSHSVSGDNNSRNGSRSSTSAATSVTSSSLHFSSVQNSGNRLDFKIGSGPKVHIYQGDMLHQPTEVIVNSANDQLAHGGGLARAILTAGGPQIDAESREIIKSRGALHMGDVVHTTAGNLPKPIQYVIHAVPPSLHQMDMKKDEANRALVKVFSGSLKYADSTLYATSISLPPFGAGIFAVPIKYIMGAALQGLEEFDRSVQSASKLEDIHLISNDAKLAREMVDAFQRIIDGQAGDGTQV